MTQVQSSWIRLQIPEPQPMDRGYPPGSLWQTFPAVPVVGSPAFCVWERGPGLEPVGIGPITPLQYRLSNGLPRPRLDPFTPEGTFPVYNAPVLAPFARLLAGWRGYVQPFVPGVWGGPAELNPACGNLTVRLALPRAGPWDPSLMLFYNSQAPQSSEFGWGWSLVPKQTLTSLTVHIVNIIEGTGTSLRYREKDSNNRYLGPGGSNDAVVFNPSDQTWTQTQADGFVIHYDSSGRQRSRFFVARKSNENLKALLERVMLVLGEKIIPLGVCFAMVVIGDRLPQAMVYREDINNTHFHLPLPQEIRPHILVPPAHRGGEIEREDQVKTGFVKTNDGSDFHESCLAGEEILLFPDDGMVDIRIRSPRRLGNTKAEAILQGKKAVHEVLGQDDVVVDQDHIIIC
jgi:hypothetical protein